MNRPLVTKPAIPDIAFCAEKQRERLQDCMMLVQSAQTTLEGIDDQVVPTVEEIRECFHSADKASARR